MSSITIAGLGMRSIIKIEGPNVSLQTLLKDFCEKNKINPEHYGLIHKKKEFDLSLPFRLSGISNNATVEVIKKASSPNVKSAATLGLQLPDGQRLKSMYPIDISLWIALKRFEKKENVNLTLLQDAKSGKYQLPSLIYMNQEFKTLEDLKKTKLSDIGLRDNSTALLRLIFITTDKTIEELGDEVEETDDFVPKNKKVKTTTTTSTVDEESQSNNVTPSDMLMVDDSPKVSDSAPSSSSSTMMEEEEEDIILENTVAKDIRLFKRGDTSFNIDNFSDINEKDFELNENDIQSMISGLRKIQDGGALITQQMREKENQKKERVYSSAIIRVRFPDGYLVQGTFKPNHTLGDVRDFIVQTLDNSETPIYMYIAPPIQRFDELSTTLKDAGLVPASIINVGLDRKNPKSESFESPKLKADLLSQVTEVELVSVPKNENVVRTAPASTSTTTGKKSEKNVKNLLSKLTGKKH